MCMKTNLMHCLLLVYLTYLYMFRASTAHHQEVECMYVTSGTSKMTVSETGS
jgi:hypothetical protein